MNGHDKINTLVGKTIARIEIDYKHAQYVMYDANGNVIFRCGIYDTFNGAGNHFIGDYELKEVKV